MATFNLRAEACGTSLTPIILEYKTTWQGSYMSDDSELEVYEEVRMSRKKFDYFLEQSHEMGKKEGLHIIKPFVEGTKDEISKLTQLVDLLKTIVLRRKP